MSLGKNKDIFHYVSFYIVEENDHFEKQKALAIRDKALEFRKECLRILQILSQR